MLSPVKVAILSLNVVVLGLFHEGLRVVFHWASGPTVPRCEPCHCDETHDQNEVSCDGASRRRANSGGQAVVTSDEIGSVDREVSHVLQKDPFGELISYWLVTTLATLGFLLAMCGWTVYCADCLRPKRDSMHGAPSESWRAPVLLQLDGARAIRFQSALRRTSQMGRMVAPLEGA